MIWRKQEKLSLKNLAKFQSEICLGEMDMYEYDSIEFLRNEIKTFIEERDWDQFHSPENLAKSVSIEAGELLECFQWGQEPDMEAVTEEIADVMNYCLLLSDKLGIDSGKAIHAKIQKNAEKYPVEKSRGTSVKYDRL